jgi:hypothetical protein
MLLEEVKVLAAEEVGMDENKQVEWEGWGKV